MWTSLILRFRLNQWYAWHYFCGPVDQDVTISSGYMYRKVRHWYVTESAHPLQFFLPFLGYLRYVFFFQRALDLSRRACFEGSLFPWLAPFSVFWCHRASDIQFKTWFKSQFKSMSNPLGISRPSRYIPMVIVLDLSMN
jgi:hypothetical protein